MQNSLYPKFVIVIGYDMQCNDVVVRAALKVDSASYYLQFEDDVNVNIDIEDYGKTILEDTPENRQKLQQIISSNKD